MHREKLQAVGDAWDGPGLGARIEMRELAGRADQRPTTHDPRPTTRTGNGHCDLAAGSAVGVCAGGLYRSGAFGEIALPRRRSGEVGFVAGPQDVAQKASHKGPEPSPGGLQVQCLLEMPGRRENAGDAGSGDPACRGTRRLGGAL